MAEYIDEFESLFSQLERMGDDTKISVSHKAPLLIESMGNSSLYEPSVAALRTRDTDQLSWDAVSADLIQEWTQIKYQIQDNGDNKSNNGDDRTHETGGSRHRNRRFRANCTNVITCTFCGKENHTADECYSNPNTPKCKLPSKLKESLKSMKTAPANSSNKGEVHHFGGDVTLGTRNSVNKAESKRSGVILDSGATITMFKNPSEALEGCISQVPVKKLNSLQHLAIQNVSVPGPFL